MGDFEIHDGMLEEYTGDETDVTVPDGVRVIGPDAFDYADVERVRLPDGVRKIDEEAFMNCGNLEEIVLPDSLEYIGVNAFCNTRHLRAVKLPKGLKKLREWAFHGSGLREIEIPEGITQIEDSVFANCFDLETVRLPSTLKTIWFGAFGDDDKLKNINLSPDVRVYGNAFGYCEGLADKDGFIVLNGMLFQSSALYKSYEIRLPESVRVIKSGSIDVRRNMDGVVRVPKNADTSSNRVGSVFYLPDSVEEIEMGAFDGDVLKIISASTAPFGPHSLMGRDRLVSLTVPKGTVISERAFGDWEEQREKFKKLKIIYK